MRCYEELEFMIQEDEDYDERNRSDVRRGLAEFRNKYADEVRNITEPYKASIYYRDGSSCAPLIIEMRVA